MVLLQPGGRLHVPSEPAALAGQLYHVDTHVDNLGRHFLERPINSGGARGHQRPSGPSLCRRRRRNLADIDAHDHGRLEREKLGGSRRQGPALQSTCLLPFKG